MKCKQGDMALIIKSAAGNEGKVVTCLEFIGRGPVMMRSDSGREILLADVGDWWRVDRDLHMYMQFDNGICFIEENWAPFALDHYLMPINGKPEEEIKREVSASLV